ncbi:flagellar basal body P-ring formation chaperone FlgA [Mesorhizobium xinjiangense]|uniref:flagellar basal body P-ring formation chaperone FlgA n=1 Tax=Mesorhizobium xinjiangense TaxID=2678685 RepID=UPI0012ECEFD8|nr:flagellar basal body P-ring formation chaperone FlgA [Mesorhizobium xinjiangense]
MSGRLSAKTLCALAVALAASCGAGPAIAQDVVVTPKRVIYPGETVQADALKEVTLRAGRKAPGSVALVIDQIEGKVARRTLLPGKYVSLSALREAYAVEAGTAVQVKYIQGALRISTTGVPLQPGAIGDVVKVRNLDSGSILSGMVMADGTIRVGGR